MKGRPCSQTQSFLTLKPTLLLLFFSFLIKQGAHECILRTHRSQTPHPEVSTSHIVQVLSAGD